MADIGKVLLGLLVIVTFPAWGVLVLAFVLGAMLLEVLYLVGDGVVRETRASFARRAQRKRHG
jgi:hypothetical protein